MPVGLFLYQEVIHNIPFFFFSFDWLRAPEIGNSPALAYSVERVRFGYDTKDGLDLTDSGFRTIRN